MAMTSSSIFAFCTRMLRVPGSHAQSFVPDQHVSKLHFGARSLLPVHLSSHIELSFCYESCVHRCPLLLLLVLQGAQFARVKSTNVMLIAVTISPSVMLYLQGLVCCHINKVAKKYDMLFILFNLHFFFQIKFFFVRKTKTISQHGYPQQL